MLNLPQNEADDNEIGSTTTTQIGFGLTKAILSAYWSKRSRKGSNVSSSASQTVRGLDLRLDLEELR